MASAPRTCRARAALHGLDLANTSPAHLYRAAMEGATFSLRYGFDAFVRAGMSFDSVVLTGGGSNSGQWRQMVADVFGLPVQVSLQAEGAAFGAALQALWASRRAAGEDIAPNVVCDAHVIHDPSRIARPDRQNSQAYTAAYQRFLHHLDAACVAHAALPA